MLHFACYYEVQRGASGCHCHAADMHLLCSPLCRYTLNIETGILGQPPPEGHWKRVAGMLKDRYASHVVMHQQANDMLL